MSFSDIVEGVVEKLCGSGDSYHLQSLKKNLTTNDWTIIKDGAPLFEVRCLSEKERKKAELIAIDILTGKIKGVSLFAIEVLGELRTKTSHPYLRNYLQTADGHTSAVASALYKIDGSHEWVEVVLRDLQNSNKERRISAVRVLSQFNTPETIDACFTSMEQDTDYTVRWSAFLSLCEIFEGNNWQAAREEIQRSVSVCSDDEDTRRQAVVMLRKRWGVCSE